jgi:hypothetical protein
MRLQTEAVVGVLRSSPKFQTLDFDSPKVKEIIAEILLEELKGWITKAEAEDYANRVVGSHKLGHLTIA